MFGLPAMLGWLAAAAVPILIHLLTRQRSQRVEWGAMEFLMRAVKKQQRRVRLEDLLLLLLRVAAVLMLILALAEPRLEKAGLLGGPEERREVVLVVDTSFSMAFRESTGETPFRRALDRARGLVRDLRSERGDTVTLVTAGSPAALRLSRDSDLGRVDGELERLETGDAATDLSGAMRAVVAKLDDLPKGAEVVVFTDLQKSALSPGGDEGGKAFDGLVAAIKSKGATLTLVPCGKGVADNLAVTSITMASKLAQVGRPTRFSVAVRNFGTRPAGGVVNFSVDGADAGGDATTIDTIEPGKEAVVDFRHTFGETGPHLVEARFVTDALENDNRRALSVVVQDRVETRIVDGAIGAEKGDGSAFFLEAALDPTGGEDRRGAFGVVVDDEAGFERADLSKTALVVLADVGRLSTRRGDDLEAFVARGGGLLIFAGDRFKGPQIDAALARDGKGLLPARLGVPIGTDDSTDAGFEFALVEGTRGPLRYFADERVRAILPSIPFRRILTTTPLDDGSVTTYARFASRKADGGAPHPAVLERAYGSGRVILVSTTASRAWNDLAAFPSFVPFVREMAYHLVRRASELENLTVGGSWRGEIETNSKKATLYHNGRPIKELDALAVPNKERRFELRTESLDRAGTWRIEFPPSDDGKTPTPIRLAVNVDPVESDLARTTPEVLAARFPAGSIKVLDDPAAKEGGADADSEGRLWWWGLVAALGLFLLETWVGQWIGKSRGGAA